jgi:hypothetical protein
MLIGGTVPLLFLIIFWSSFCETRSSSSGGNSPALVRTLKKSWRMVSLLWRNFSVVVQILTK